MKYARYYRVSTLFVELPYSVVIQNILIQIAVYLTMAKTDIYYILPKDCKSVIAHHLSTELFIFEKHYMESMVAYVHRRTFSHINQVLNTVDLK